MSAHSQKNLLINIINDPEIALALKPIEWENLLHLARQSKLLAYLDWLFAQSDLKHLIPPAVLLHFDAAMKMVANRNRMILWELNRIKQTTFDLKIKTIVLKGAGYLILDLPFAHTRILSDLDILVDRFDLARFENKLKKHGWQGVELDEYDQQYYRKWMHEVPPMRHEERYVEVDLHHTILPLTSRLCPPVDLMIGDATVIKEKGIATFSPLDLIIHSSVHLFYDAEIKASDFRDLVDLHELIIWFHRDNPGFFTELVDRAEFLNLQRPVFYALFFTKKILGTSIPDQYIEHNQGRPNAILLAIMSLLVSVSILPNPVGQETTVVRFSRWLLYVRSHYLRMPMTLLLPHLFKKSKKRIDDFF